MKFHVKRRILSTLLISFYTVFLLAQSGKKLEVLFLGNSYTSVNNLPLVVSNLAKANGDTLVFETYAPGGYTFQNHYYDNTAKAKISSRKWDFVVLQAQSQEPSFPPSQVNVQTLPYAIYLNDLIEKNDSCTRTIFYETWGRKNGDASNCAFYPPVCTYTGMQNRLRESYKLFADTCKAIMAPAGEAWRKSIATDPKLELYSSDQSHPALEGTYLTACVFYEVIFGKTVVGNSYTANMLPYPSQFLQQTAHDVVNDSLDVWNIGKYDPCKLSTGTSQIHHNKLKLYPNPAGESVRFEIEQGDIPVTAKIISLTGMVIDVKTLSENTLNVSSLPPGMYLIEIQTMQGKSLKEKFMKH